jgi:hypothetical protein
MTTESIVGMLIFERDKLNRAIQALGGEVSGGSAPSKRLGRPAKKSVAIATQPDVSTPGATVAPATPARKKVSAEGRKRQIEAMRKYWAAKRAADKKAAK